MSWWLHTVRDRVEHQHVPFVDVSSRSIFFYLPPFFLIGLLGRGSKKKFVFQIQIWFLCRINNQIEGGDWEQTIGYTRVCVCRNGICAPESWEFFGIQIFRFSANAEETLAGIFFSCFIESYYSELFSLFTVARRISPNGFHLRHSAGSPFFSFLGRKEKTKK